jgi:hypothetical protein
LSIIKENWAKLKTLYIMLYQRKHIVENGCRILQDPWTNKYFCISVNRKALCLICSKSIAVLKEYNITRHYNLKHKEKYKKLWWFSEKKKSGRA